MTGEAEAIEGGLGWGVGGCFDVQRTEGELVGSGEDWSADQGDFGERGERRCSG